jgi:phosphoglycerate dehydrogenase-like enzyme
MASMTRDRPVRLLASTLAREQIEAQVANVMGQRAYQFVLPSVVQAPSDGCDIAFVSRDVTSTSTKQDVLPSTQAFYNAMRVSPNLRWVHVHSAGIDRPIYTELQTRGVRVTPSVGANATVVAQAALAGLLALSRRMPLLMQAQAKQHWLPLHGHLMPRDLAGQHMTLVGWGAIGQTLAKYAQMLGLRVTVARYSGAQIEGISHTIGYKDLPQVLPSTDWLVLACPLSEQTRGLISAPQLAALPEGAQVINVSRGEVIDEQALITCLQSGHIAGAYLDVFTHEPLPAASPLWKLPHVIATPHCAGFSDGNVQRVASIFIDHLRIALESEWV